MTQPPLSGHQPGYNPDIDWLGRCLDLFGLPWSSIYGKQLREQLRLLHTSGLLLSDITANTLREELERLREVEARTVRYLGARQDVGRGVLRRRRQAMDALTEVIDWNAANRQGTDE